MKQELKNKYYELIETKDYETLSLINSIFTKIDTLVLTERGSDKRQKFLELISVLEFTEEKLYQVMCEDIKNEVFE